MLAVDSFNVRRIKDDGEARSVVDEMIVAVAHLEMKGRNNQVARTNP